MTVRKGYIFVVLAIALAGTAALRAQNPDAKAGMPPAKEVYAPEMLPTVWYTDGVRLAAEEDLDAARAKFEQALGLDPGHAPSLYELANLYAMEGELDKALGYSTRASELDPDNIWFRGQKARLLVYLNRFEEALPLFESMLGNTRGFEPDNYRILALLYHQQGRVDDALATLDSAEMRLGRNAAIVEVRRGLLLEAGRVDEAVADAEAFVRATPWDEENRLVLADLYAYQGRDSLGVAMLKEVLEVNPDNVEALTALADHYLDGGSAALFFATVKQLFLLDEVPLKGKLEYFGKLTSNRSFYRQNYPEINDLALLLVTRYPGNGEVMEIYSSHMINSGDIEGALQMLKTLAGQPDAPLSSFLTVMQIEAYLQRPDSVALYGDRALKAYPGETDVYVMKSAALQHLGNMNEARKVLEKALKTAASDSIRSVLHGSIGNLRHQEGKMKQAFAQYEKALRYDPNNDLVLNNYAYFLSEEGRELDRALGMASRAIKLVENSATYLDTYAWVLYKLGNYADARRAMQQALPLDRENSPVLLVHYGDILYALGEKFMASVYWKRARDAGYEDPVEIEERLTRLE